MSKKILALVLIMLMIISLAACSTNNSSDSDKKILKVAMECAYAPYNWTQSSSEHGALPISGSNDYANGYDVMMAKKIAQELGYEVEIVKLDWDSLIPALMAGKVDMVIAGQSITEERQKSVDFSIPYYYASVVTLVKDSNEFADAKNINDLSTARVTSQLNTIWYDVCAPQIPDADILPAQESTPAALVALMSDKVDIFITDIPTATAAMVAYPELKILDFNELTDGNYKVSNEDVEIGISFKKGSHLKEKVDGVLSKLSVDDFEKMMDEAVKNQPLGN